MSNNRARQKRDVQTWHLARRVSRNRSSSGRRLRAALARLPDGSDWVPKLL